MRTIPYTKIALFLALAAVCGSVAPDAGASLYVDTPQAFVSLDGSASDDDGATNGTLTINGDLVITNAGSIHFNDPAAPVNSSAGNVRIVCTGNLSILGGNGTVGGIFAENRVSGGSGGNIDLLVGGDLTILTGGMISSRKTSADAGGASGNITIDVGGDLTMAPGSAIQASKANWCCAGDITIAVGGTAELCGTVQAAVTKGLTGTSGTNLSPDGGAIWIEAQCGLTVCAQGLVSSLGMDRGPDLVHLDACTVTIIGKVESSGAGHSLNVDNKVSPPFRPDKPANATAGVEIWGGEILVTGEIAADTGQSGGGQGTSWIDLLASGDVTVIGPTGAVFAVHVNGLGGTSNNGGTVTVKSQNGDVSTRNRALQASAQTSGGADQAGGAGGLVAVEASGDIDAANSTLEARGDNVRTGGYGAGGDVSLRAFNGTVSWANGVGNVLPTGTEIANAAQRGEIALQDCTAGAINVGGAAFPFSQSAIAPNPDVATTPTELADACGGAPVVAAYVVLPPVDCATQCEEGGQGDECVVCNGEVVVVDQNVEVNFNVNPPAYSGDPDLQPYFSYDKSGPTPDTWKAIFNVGPRALIITNGAVVTVTDVPNTSNNRNAPGIRILSECTFAVADCSAVLVDAMNKFGGDIEIQVNGEIVINGTVANRLAGTNGKPGDIQIVSCCAGIETGPKSLIETLGQDCGGSDITLLSCSEGDIVINGMVDASYKGLKASTITIAAFGGDVLIDGNNWYGLEAGTQRPILSGVTVRSRRDPLPGRIFIQALGDVTVLGNVQLDWAHPNHGAVAIKTASNSSRGGLIDVRALTGRIVASDRAIDNANRFNDTAENRLLAGDSILLSNTGRGNSVPAGGASWLMPVVSVQAGDTGKGGRNILRAYSGGIVIGPNAQVLADWVARPGANGQNLLTACAAVLNDGFVIPADANLGDDGGTCAVAVPDALFLGCEDFDVICDVENQEP